VPPEGDSRTTTPCSRLATTYAATAANGEIYLLDPAKYGSQGLGSLILLLAGSTRRESRRA
jgi:hypothetical protein